jgi:GNAT superfamily N-acetyltransferase
MNIRTLTVFERDAVRDFYLSLSADDRRKRFCSALTDVSISNYVCGLDFERHTILGAFDESGELVGLAELALGAKESELAFSVRPDQRSQGLGTKLMERILLRARMGGIRKVVVMFLSDNTPMRKLATRTGMLVKADGAETYASLELAVPSNAEFNRWFIEEAIAHSEYFSFLGTERRDSLVNHSNSTVSRHRRPADSLTV